MRIRLVFRIAGKVLFIEAAAMLPPFVVSLIYREGEFDAFLISMAATAASGLLMLLLTREARSSRTNEAERRASLQPREGFAIVAAAWVMMSLFGSLPFLISGTIPSFGDALFETVSGFTTTGATILSSVETLPKSILFWRSFTHWIGGMGVLLLFLALLPSMGGRSIQLLRAESPGPSPSKLVPRIGETAKILYAIYVALTAAEVIALAATGMPFFDSLTHAFSTAGTGGFSIRDASVGAYGNTAAELVIGAFMLLFGINFAVYYHILKRQFGRALRNTELLVYLGLAAASVLLVASNIRPLYERAGQALGRAFFQVSSLITTTGFVTADYNAWPEFSKTLLIMLAVIGACSGSTSGGVKLMRMVILIKTMAREIKKIIHPRSVNLVRVDGQALGEDVVSGCMQFFSAYICVLMAGTLVVSLDSPGYASSFTAVLACLSNIGPGLGLVGPAGNYGELSYLSKAVLSLCMLLGRLEIFPVLVILAPGAWKKS